jgi:hypothetical protein
MHWVHVGTALSHWRGVDVSCRSQDETVWLVRDMSIASEVILTLNLHFRQGSQAVDGRPLNTMLNVGGVDLELLGDYSR